MPAMRGNKSFTAHVNGEARQFRWSTIEERTEIIRELRAGGLRAARIAKLLGVSKSHVYRGTKTPEGGKYTELHVRVRTDIYDLACRYSLRHGVKMCDAVGILIRKGAEAINFKPDERT